MKTFEVIKKLAEKQGKSLQKVAEDLNFGANYLYRLRDQNPTAEKLIALADYFHVSVDYLLGRDSIKYTQPPTEKVVVPQFVADWFEKFQDKKYLTRACKNVFLQKWTIENEPEEVLEWIELNFTDFIHAWRDGYTVEKEKKFLLKNKITGGYLYKFSSEEFIETDVTTYNNRFYKKQCLFTQQEIDNMETGSYEQIEVEE